MVENLTAIAIVCPRAYRGAPLAVATDVISVAVAGVAAVVVVVEATTVVVVVVVIGCCCCCSCCLRNLPTDSR